tara:strand:+ start:1024 stop:1617 length:594 start_codon:yes stop_codon:yes gene_type:complete
MNSYYIINTYYNDHFLSSSDIFESYTKALEVKNILDNNSTTKTSIFKCQPFTNENNENIFSSGMTLHKYSNGYLLIPTKDNVYYGMGHFNRGEWCEDIEGWFYKKSEYNALIERGYKLEKKLKFDYKKYNIGKLEIYFYKNGFILLPYKDYKYYGQTYLLGGKWDNDQNGWYFKKTKKYSKFINIGAIDNLNNTFME